MKQVSFILILIVMQFASVNSFANNELESKAEKAYADKKYKEAISAYEDILKTSLSSYKLYYNLGNAYYKNNELGKAIYNYELANKLQPNNEDIKTNLKIANEKKIDDIESKENFFLSAIKSGLVNTLTPNGWAWLSITSLSCCFILFLAFYISSNKLFKRLGFFLSLISSLVFMSSMILGYTALNSKEKIKFAIIIAKETKILEEPNADGNSKFSLHEGTKVKVLESNAVWTNIKLENGNEGWLKTKDVGLF